MAARHNVLPGDSMSELHHSLETMGVLQYFFAVAFLICYALAIGDFLGPGARTGVLATAAGSASAFAFFTEPWVHGVLLIAFAVVGIGLFIGVTWLLKALFASAVGEVSVEAAYDDAVSAVETDQADGADDVGDALPEPGPAATVPARLMAGDAPIGRLLGADAHALDRRPS